MCGIAGFIDDRLNEQQASDNIRQMLHLTAHRGPDARGHFHKLPLTFGHNRLSIIDLSADGNQPMQYFDAVITYNGEIYNYLEVKKELEKKGYAFTTHSDTEVILAAYREYGDRCVDHFVGMWAFAIYDLLRDRLFCSRDRFGIKPFYYIHDGDRFYFASELKALKCTNLFKADLNQQHISRFLQLGWACYGDETIYSGIKSLPAACNLFFSNGRITRSQYWDLESFETNANAYREKKERFLELFSDSIRLHLRSDVEVGGCLSGGIDSSSIASMVAKQNPQLPFKTFTIYYDGIDEVDERPFADEVLKHYPALLPHYFKPDEQDLSRFFHQAMQSADMPLPGSSPVSQFFVMQLASKAGIKVLLDGQGADEMLGGYMHSFYRYVGGLIRQFRFAESHIQFHSHKRMQNMSTGKAFDVFFKSLLTVLFGEQRLYELEYHRFYPFLSDDRTVPFDLKNISGSRLPVFLYHMMFNTSLPSLLQYEDRNSMAFGIESRVPFLDHRLVEFIFGLKDNDKLDRGVTKKILRDSLAGILPEKIATRHDKKGFVTPGEIRWLRGPLNFLVEDELSELNFLRMDKISGIISRFKKGSNKEANLVWRVAVLNYWLKHFRFRD